MVKSIKDSTVFRMAIVALLGIMLLIPVSSVRRLILESQQTRDTAISEVTEKWGRTQTVTGPILTLPVKHRSRSSDGTVKTYTELHHFLPDKLIFNTRLNPKIRHRGIYQVVLYNAHLTVDAVFPNPLPNERIDPDDEVIWEDAFLTFGISDPKGLKGISTATFGDKPLLAEPGLRTKDLVQSGLTFKTPLSPNESPGSFKLEMSLNGSEEFKVSPLGKETKLTAQSSWNAPSFIGYFLPETREVTGNSFSASWNVLHLNRSLPQTWVGSQPRLEEAAFGVKLVLPVDE